MPSHLRLILPAIALLMLVPARASGTTFIGGEQLNPGEKAHEFYLGFPSVGYQWDFAANGKRTTGLQIGALVWPFTVHAGISSRKLLGIVGRSVISFRFEPGVFVGFYGGSRGFYENLRWGRSSSLDMRIAPVVNLGVAASIDLKGNWSFVLGFENPVAVWFLLSRFGWWVEWPILANLGLEYDISYKSTLFVKGAVGPILGFTGEAQFAGVSFEVLVGIQTNYE